MPVRSLTSSVLKWPDRETVDRAVRAWAHAMAEAYSEIVRIGYIGSYARGDWGPGSDVDLVILVETSAGALIRRAVDALDLPVPADLFVYTVEEWEGVRPTRFGQMVEREAVWVYVRATEPGPA